MRAIFAILVGGLMVWTQTAAALSPHYVQQVMACQCCHCANPGCNTQTTVPAPVPSPAVQSSISQKEKASPRPEPTVSAARSLASTTGRTPPVQTVSPAVFPPLFQRHCVRLI